MLSSVEVQASGHDLTDLLYHLLDEWLGYFLSGDGRPGSVGSVRMLVHVHVGSKMFH